MFNASERLPVVVDMIMARTLEERKAALSKLLPMQRQDFEDIFRIVAPHPVTIRLLDPPMHEFLPSEQQLIDDIEALKEYRLVVKGRTVALGALHLNNPADNEASEEHVNSIIAKKEGMLRKVRDLHEVNPMLGHRGVRIGMTYPEIYDMQIRAILEAEAACLKAGIKVCPEIMVPQVITVQELTRVRASVDRIRDEVEQRYGLSLTFKFGSMIETVRACTRAADLAHLAEFFSFGTNDLTQATYSFSREDAENKFLPLYTETGILHDNPFETIDIKGVGVLMQMSVDLGRSTNPNLKIGICGEQGGDPASIRFCHEIGINYVSCSPPRVPVARLAAAQATLQSRGLSAAPSVAPKPLTSPPLKAPTTPITQTPRSLITPPSVAAEANLPSTPMEPPVEVPQPPRQSEPPITPPSEIRAVAPEPPREILPPVTAAPAPAPAVSETTAPKPLTNDPPVSSWKKLKKNVRWFIDYVDKPPKDL